MTSSVCSIYIRTKIDFMCEGEISVRFQYCEAYLKVSKYLKIVWHVVHAFEMYTKHVIALLDLQHCASNVASLE